MNLINKQDKIFVAGHKGMVGSSIVRNLRLTGYKNIITSSRDDLDLRDQNQVKKWFLDNSPDIVILAAAKVGGIYANSSFPTEFLLDNLKIQNNVIETSWQAKVKRLLFLGSSCIYPKYSEQPIKEESLLSGSLEPTNESYALAKISGIKLCQSLREQYKFDAISLMPTNLYGTGDNYHPMNSHVMPALIRKFHEAKNGNIEEVVCWGSGSPMREFLHVDDLGKACIFALENWDPETKDAPKDKFGKVLTYLNVGTGIDISIKNLAYLISEIIGYEGSISWDEDKPDGTPKKLLDISKVTELGWRPEINLRDGILNTIKEFSKLSV